MKDKILGTFLLVCAFLFPFFLGKLFFLPQYILFCILLVVLFFMFADGKVKISFYIFPFLLFLLLSCISSTYTFSAWATRNELIRSANYFILFYLFLILFQDKKSKNYLINTLLLSSFFVCMFGILIYILMGERNFLIFSVFFNPNCFAGYLILILPLAIYKFTTSSSFIRKNRYASLIIILVISLFLTASRGAALSFLISGIIWLIVTRKSIRIDRGLKIVVMLCVAVVIPLLLTSPILQEKFFSFFNLHSRSHLYRVLVWEGTINIVRNYPVAGTGAGTFETVYPNYKLGGVNTKLTHNTYLQVASELGIIGLFSFLFLCCFILLKLFYQFRQEQNNKDKLFVSSILFSVTGFLLHNLFDYTWYIPAISLIFFATVATGINKNILLKEISVSKKILIIFSVLISATVTLSIRYGIAEWYNEKGEYQREKNIKVAEKYFKRATNLDKISAKYFDNLGNVYLIQHKYILAKESYIQATKLEKHSAFYHTGLGITYLKMGNLEKAIHEFETAQKLHKTFTPPIRELGNIYFQQKKFKEAKHEFQKIVKISKNKYFQEKYLPIPNQPQNPDFKYAEEMIKIIDKLQQR